MKRIKKVIFKRDYDENPDLSWLGTFSDEKGKFAVKHGNTPSEFAFFNADNVDNMRQARQNYHEVMEFENENKSMMGVTAEAEIQTSSDGNTWLINHISSGGLWGIDSTDEDTLKDEELGQFEDLKNVLLELGFSELDIINAKK